MKAKTSLKHQTKLWLLEAAQDHTAPRVVQNEELRSFLAQTTCYMENNYVAAMGWY